MKGESTGLCRLLSALICAALMLALGACGDRYGEGYAAGQADAERALTEAARQEGYAAGYEAGREDGYAMGAQESAPSAEKEPAETLPEGFVWVTDVVPEAILEIRYYSTFNFVGRRIDGYEAPMAILTEEAAAALKAVSDDLMARGYRIKLYDAYRPQRAVDDFIGWARQPGGDAMRPYFYPELEKADLFARGYVSAKSGHSRGSTVDVTLVDMATGREMDMGGGFDYFGKLSHSEQTAGLTEEQIGNRRLLRETMTAHGFRSLATEWWHFTLENEPYPDTYFDFPVALPGQ